MKKIGIIGHYAFGKVCLNGQTIKTQILTDQLKQSVGDHDVCCFDTHGRWRFLLKAPFLIFSALRQSRNIIMLPAYKGVLIITPLLTLFNLLFHRSLHYVVVGGWLPSYVQRFPILRTCLRRFDGIYVETHQMKRQIEQYGFDNLVILPNCKELHIQPSDLSTSQPPNLPLRLCTFSRVMQMKGIEDAIEAVRRVNEEYQSTIYDLTIYGPVWPPESEWFESLKTTFPPYVHYGSSVPFESSVDTLRDYFALLFPTRFQTEGVPGTIIDAYAAGLPVISARWESFDDVIEEGTTGYGYTLGSTDELVSRLKDIYQHPELITTLRQACTTKAQSFLPANVIPLLTAHLK